MFPLDGRTVAVLGSTAAAVIAGVYVLWGPSDGRRKKRKDICPGLVNLGNTCFLNAILQGLAPCQSVVSWLGDFIDKHIGKKYSTFLAYTLIKLLKVLNNEGPDTNEQDEVSPVDVIDALRARRWVISSDEQDAHELFHVLTETLEEETSKYPTVVSLFDIQALQEGPDVHFQSYQGAVNRNGSMLPVLPGRDTDHPFRGLLASQLQCKHCSHKCPVRYDTFDSLSLSIPTSYLGALTLDQMLKQYIMSETVRNVDCDGCARLQKNKLAGLNSADPGAALLAAVSTVPKTTFLKKLTIGKLPQCLCIHVQRTVWLDNGMPMKRFEHIQFPEVLDMAEYVYNQRHRDSLKDSNTRLVGGKDKVENVSPEKPKIEPSAPYTQPLNLLKALNYHKRATMNGFYVQPKQSSIEDQLLSDNLVGKFATKSLTKPKALQFSNYAYKLVSVIVHLGDVFSGHFVTYRRSPSATAQLSEKWLFTSDSVVRKSSLSEALNADAYMLFYEKT